MILTDIPILLEPTDIALPDGTALPDGLLDRFHTLCRAAGAYELIDSADSPLAEGESGAAAVAVTLGSGVDELGQTEAGRAVLKAALFRLEAYLNYRLQKYLAPKHLYLGHPAVPGGAAAPDLTADQVLTRLPAEKLGVSWADGRLSPQWSIAYFYPIHLAPADKPAACAGCRKDCAIRRD